MIVTSQELFIIYLTLFLAVVILAWIITVWRRQRSRTVVRRYFICKICGGNIRADLPRVWIRCPRCGARHELKDLEPVRFLEEKK